MGRIHPCVCASRFVVLEDCLWPDEAEEVANCVFSLLFQTNLGDRCGDIGRNISCALRITFCSFLFDPCSLSLSLPCYEEERSLRWCLGILSSIAIGLLLRLAVYGIDACLRFNRNRDNRFPLSRVLTRRWRSRSTTVYSGEITVETLHDYYTHIGINDVPVCLPIKCRLQQWRTFLPTRVVPFVWSPSNPHRILSYDCVVSLT